jgi:hypothetical protein
VGAEAAKGLCGEEKRERSRERPPFDPINIDK